MNDQLCAITHKVICKAAGLNAAISEFNMFVGMGGFECNAGLNQDQAQTDSSYAETLGLPHAQHPILVVQSQQLPDTHDHLRRDGTAVHAV